MTSSTARGRSRRPPARSELRFVAPMECTPVPKLPDDRSKWIYEVKLDGYRCCAIVARGKATLYSRYGNAWPERFPNITSALRALEQPLVLDGEIVAIDQRGRPSFQQLQNWQSTRLPIVFYAFDITNAGGRDLTRLPIEARKEILAAIPFDGPLRLSESLDADLSDLIPKMKSLGLEGVVAKRLGSRYESGQRSKSWLKQRFNQVEEFVAGGYVVDGDELVRLLVGVWRGNELHFVKKVKNGFSDFTRRQVLEAIRKLRVKKCPFVNPEDIDAEDPIWVRPVRKVEVEFVEWTAGGNLRHAFFRRLVE